MQLVSGETATVRVVARWSGLVDYGNGVHWTFRSDNERVAIAFVRMENSQPQDVRITATGPGSAFIRYEQSNGALSQEKYVTIKVVCGAEPPVYAAAPVVQARLNQTVALAAVSDIANRTLFTWYLGREGDRSHPLAATGPRIELTATRLGTQYVWVSAMTPCSATSAEIRLEVVPLRGRAVR